MTGPVPPSASEESGAASRAPAVRRLTAFNVILLGAQAAALSLYLLPQWLHNPDLAHGLFMPVIFLGVLVLGHRSEPGRHPRGGAAALAATSALALAALAALVMAGLFAVSLGWAHNLVFFMVTAAYGATWLAALAALSQAPVSFWPLNWITVSAALLWLLAAPMPPGTYTHLTLALQSWVTGHVLGALQVLGVAARQHGNIIELAGATVGVEEACSGIRSLVSCVFAALLFSALWVGRPWARAFLVLVAAPLAIGMNFLRSLTLTLLANAGVGIGGFWHSATGYAVLVVTAALLAGLAFLLARRPDTAARGAPASAAAPPPGRALFASQAVLAGLLVLTSAVAAFFVIHTRPGPPADRPPPDWSAVLPAAADGWTVATTADVGRFADVLQTNRLVQRTYVKGGGDDLVQITVFLAYWYPGQTSVSNVAVHTPDACWPGAGWQAVPGAAATVALVVGGRTLAPAEHRLFTSDGFPQHVWYWHLYDGTPIAQRDPRSPRELLSIAWRYGFRKNGDQMFIRISSNQPWNRIAAEPLLGEIFARLRPFGL